MDPLDPWEPLEPPEPFDEPLELLLPVVWEVPAALPALVLLSSTTACWAPCAGGVATAVALVPSMLQAVSAPSRVRRVSREVVWGGEDVRRCLMATILPPPGRIDHAVDWKDDVGVARPGVIPTPQTGQHARSDRGGLEGLGQVRDEVVDVLDADAQAHEPVGQPVGGAHLDGHVRVRLHRRARH